MRGSTKPPLRRGQWLDVEAGLFDVRNLGLKARVVILAEGRDHVLVQFRRQQHAIPKGRGYLGRALGRQPVENSRSEDRYTLSQRFGSA